MDHKIHFYRWANAAENCSVSGDDSAALHQRHADILGGMSAEFYQFVMHVVITGILCTFGLIGNFLSLIVFFKYKAHSLTFYLLRPLAIADNVLLLMTIALMVLPSVYPYLGVLEWAYREEPKIADWAWPIGMTAQTASIWSIVLVALDRFVAICQPFKARVFRKLRNIKISVGAVIIFSIIFNIPRLFEKRSVAYHSVCTNMTSTRYEKLILKYPVYRFGYFVVAYTLIDIIIPLAILSYVNTRLIMELRSGAKRRNHKCQNTLREDKTMTKLSIVIVIVFTICQPPSLVTQVLDATEEYLDTQMLVFREYYIPFSNAMVVLNSSVNFAVCFFFCRGFRRSLAKLLNCGRHLNDDTDADRHEWSKVTYYGRDIETLDYTRRRSLAERLYNHANTPAVFCDADENTRVVTKI